MKRRIGISLLALVFVLPLTAEAGISKVRGAVFNDAPAAHYEHYYQPSSEPVFYKKAAVRTGVRSEARTLSFPDIYETAGKKTFVFDPKQGGFATYDESGHLVKTGHASGGAAWCKDIGSSCRTKVGTFHVYNKKGADCKSSKFPIRHNGRNGGAPMPYCMFFHNGLAVHASNDVPTHNASHGCVRVRPDDAKWLHESFMGIGTKVIVRPYGT